MIRLLIASEWTGILMKFRNTKRSNLVLLLTAGMTLAIVLGCGSGNETEPEPATSTPAPTVVATSAPDPANTDSPNSQTPATWVYWLSEIDLDAIANEAPPVAVIDYSQVGGPPYRVQQRRYPGASLGDAGSRVGNRINEHRRGGELLLLLAGSVETREP